VRVGAQLLFVRYAEVAHAVAGLEARFTSNSGIKTPGHLGALHRGPHWMEAILTSAGLGQASSPPSNTLFGAHYIQIDLYVKA
jgi:hypothetical protein